MQKSQWFTTVHSEGALLPVDVLERIAVLDSNSVEGLTAASYHHEGERLNEVMNQSWQRLQTLWRRFQTARQKLPVADSGTTLTRERWLLPLFSELGYGWLTPAPPIEMSEKSYPVSHRWNHTPIHLVSYKLGLDERTRGRGITLRTSPYSLVQEVVNRAPQYLWGIVSNGCVLRLVRNNVSMTRQAYLEFDLEAMMEGEVYSDFVLFWLLCHESRFEGAQPAECWLERWLQEAQRQGIRVLDSLRDGVKAAIEALGRGFLSANNQRLRDKLRSGELSTQDYYRQLLRLVYRLIVLFVAEDRDILFRPDADEAARERYLHYYSTQRLRQLAGRRSGTRHADLYYALALVMDLLGQDGGYPELGLPALNGFLFARESVSDLHGCELANHDLLDAMRALAFTQDRQRRRPVDYKNLGSEELGSVYESLLELHPVIHLEAAQFDLQSAGGNERKTSGSYYTPTSLITSLLDTALDPVLEEACRQRNAEQAILNLKVCDPACGSGHFLIAAAHRIAKRLAMVRTGDDEPGAAERRRALRDVVGHCIYGVDINPMAVELCKVSLWMEAIEPGKPLSFLDHHIQCGNSLFGATPALLADGIPEQAFEPVEGDLKEACRRFKKRNRQEREGNQSLWNAQNVPLQKQHALERGMQVVASIDDDTVTAVHHKQEAYFRERVSAQYRALKLRADAWCAAFVWKKTNDGLEPVTEEIYRKIEQASDPDQLPQWLRETRDEIERLSMQYQFFHWHLAFPDVFRLPADGESPANAQTGWSGGFDVVLGNPPWEHTELKEQEWFARSRPDIAQAEGVARKRKIEALMSQDPKLFAGYLEAKRQSDSYSHFVRNAGLYPLCGRGRINTYAIFAELNRTLIKPQGRVGCIVQSGIATDDTNKAFFQDITTSHTLVSLYDFDNTTRIFPAVDSRYKFCLLTLTGSDCPITRADFAFFLHATSDLEDRSKRFTLTLEDLRLINPNTRTCPIFRSKRDAELTKAIYRRVPVFVRETEPAQNPWNVSFKQGHFNMTSDASLFRTYTQLVSDGWELRGNIFYKGKERCLPLYEGKMISHFDHRFGSYTLEARPESYDMNGIQHANPACLTQPRYWVHESHMPDILNSRSKGLLAFRDIARSTDARTAIFSIIPAVPCGHTTPVMLFEGNYVNTLVYFYVSSTSFVFDYFTRQKLGGTHLTFTVFKQLPVLLPEQYTEVCAWESAGTVGQWVLPRALELTYTAWDLREFARECGYEGPPFRWDEQRRFLLRCELDAAYFHLYGIARADVDYIMETFPIVKRKDEKEYGEYRTKRVILEIYDELQRAIESGQPYHTRLEPPPADTSVAHEEKTMQV